MRNEHSTRYLITGAAFLVAILLLTARIFHLQFNEGEDHLAHAKKFSRKELRLTGQRGKVLDRNGLPLAYNVTSYTVQFMRNPSLTKKEDRENYTKSMLGAIRIIEENGGIFLSSFAIRKMEDGTFDFYWPGVEKGTKRYEERVKDWQDHFTGKSKGIIRGDPPEKLFAACRTYYMIPEDASYDEAYKVLSVWQEVRYQFYSSYLPITLAKDVSMKTVAMIERNQIDLPGMQISQASSRIYPNKAMAAHIIGYMGRMTDEPMIVDYEEKGYKRDDLVGVAGIEKSQELELSGNTYERTGVQVVEVNNLGKVARVIENDNKSPKPGNNVVLTLDSKLQKRAEEVLAENIAMIRAAQDTAYREDKEDYDFYLQERLSKEIHYAETGALVVMGVQTGEVLAMASYPSFDLNIFNGGLGITKEDFAVINEDKRNPLFNNAISSRGTPGSVFKMATGLAGLAEGVIAPEEHIDDGGYYDKYVKSGEHGPSCWVRPYFNKHKEQDIVEAIKNSCNYFFFDVADNLKINRLNYWADMLGLSVKTNIELPNEVAGQIGSQESLYGKDHMSGVAALVRKQIVAWLKAACKQSGLEYTEEVFVEVATDIMDLVTEGIKSKGPDIRSLLKNKLMLTPDAIQKYNNSVQSNLVGDISASLSEIEWNPNMTIETGIGQSVTLVTPVAVARYISALVNGGDVFEARLVKAVVTPQGEVRPTQPKLIRNLGVPDLYLQKIQDGMSKVVNDEEGGTAGEVFKDFKYLDQIGGKTGTAEVSRTIDLENNSWFVAYAPREKPEIAVVVYIPSGYKGALSGYAAREILQYYLDMKYREKEPDVLPGVNSLVK